MTEFSENLIKKTDEYAGIIVSVFHRLALLGIGSATAYAAAYTFFSMFGQPSASIGDILLLFIYLELGAMVGIYFKTNHMPVRFLLYIAITALTRHMKDLMSHKPVEILEMLAVSFSTLIAAICVLVVRYSSSRFPADKKDDVA
jgi:protein PsiE